MLCHHKDFLPVFLKFQYVYIFALVGTADLHLNNLENSRIYLTYHPSLKKKSKSIVFQKLISRTTDQQIENNALQAHCLPAVSPNNGTLP